VAAGLAAGGGARGEEKAAFPAVCAFSKHLQFLDYAALGKTCKELGLDGVDLTVRKGGHVEPANLARDLPRAVEAIRAEGVGVPMISTTLTGGGDPDARPILEAAAASNIPYVRIDGGRYPDSGDPSELLAEATEGLRRLAVMARDTGRTLGFHIHSGANRIGSVVWDLHRMLHDVGIDNLGANFDVGHATVVGGLNAWDLHARLLAPHVKMAAVKDFVWEGANARWVPLGKGIVQTAEFFKTFRAQGFAGPISIHFEYDTRSKDALLEDIGAAAEQVRSTLREAGYV